MLEKWITDVRTAGFPAKVLNARMGYAQRLITTKNTSLQGGSERGTDQRVFGLHGSDEALQTGRVQRLRAADVLPRGLQENRQSCEETGLIHQVVS